MEEYLKSVHGKTDKQKKRKRLKARLENKRRLDKLWKTGAECRREKEEINKDKNRTEWNRNNNNNIKTRNNVHLHIEGRIIDQEKRRLGVWCIPVNPAVGG